MKYKMCLYFLNKLLQDSIFLQPPEIKVDVSCRPNCYRCLLIAFAIHFRPRSMLLNCLIGRHHPITIGAFLYHMVVTLAKQHDSTQHWYISIGFNHLVWLVVDLSFLVNFFCCDKFVLTLSNWKYLCITAMSKYRYSVKSLMLRLVVSILSIYLLLKLLLLLAGNKFNKYN